METSDTALPVAAVARRLGVAPATLRTWDRRYGLGPTVHEAGSHRRYGSGDLARLTVMRRLTLQGVPTGEAARLALATDTDATGDEARSGSPSGGPPRDDSEAGPAQPAARGLSRAAQGLDAQACRTILRREMQARGVVACWNDVIVPVLTLAGERYAATGRGIEVEHLLSEAVLAALRPADRSSGPASGPFVLLAAVENEQHVLPVHAVAACLAEHDVPVRVLGARTPPEALAAAMRRSRPAVVFLWSQLPETGKAEGLAALPRLRPQPQLFLGGPGWKQDDIPDEAHRPVRLEDALEGLLAAVGR